MKDKLQTIIDKHSLLSEQLADPEIFNDQKKLTTTAKEHSALEDVVNVGKEYLAVLQNIEDDKSILNGDDAELKEIAQERSQEWFKKKKASSDYIDACFTPFLKESKDKETEESDGRYHTLKLKLKPNKKKPGSFDFGAFDSSKIGRAHV